MVAGVVASFTATVAIAAAGSKKVENGKYFDASGNPTYNSQPDGTVDWYTFNGFRRYHSECSGCHGANGERSNLAPSLNERVKIVSYKQFKETVMKGRRGDGLGRDMPSFSADRDVMCYLDDIYIYLRARSDNAVPPERPVKREKQTVAAKDQEKACIGP